MAVKNYRKTRKLKGSKVRNAKTSFSTFERLPERLLNKNVVLASVIQENNKTRIQVLQGTVASFKKPKTRYLVTVRREASRQITNTSFLSLHNSTLGFLETKNCLFF